MQPVKRVCAHGELPAEGLVYIWKEPSWHPRFTSETDLRRAVQQDMSGEANISDIYTFSGWSQVPAGEMQHKCIYDLMKIKERQSGETRDVPTNSVDTSAEPGMRALGV